MSPISREELKKIFDKYVYKETGDRFTYTKTRDDLIKEDVFGDNVDKKSYQYFIATQIWYGQTNFNAISDALIFIDQSLSNQREKFLSLLEDEKLYDVEGNHGHENKNLIIRNKLRKQLRDKLNSLEGGNNEN
jgi:hypothetical protein